MSDSHSRGILDRFLSLLSGHDEPKNREELLDILKDAEKNKLIKGDAMHMIKGAIAVSDMFVEDVMVPRSHMVFLEASKPLPDLLKTIIESGHSRFPVIGNGLDDVKGILLAKDLLRFYVQHEHEAFDINKVLRKAAIVPERKRLDLVLKEFLDKHTHMALVADEHSSISGLITIEDIIEEIIGDIEDEYDLEDDEPENIRKASNHQYIVEALTTIEEFNEAFNSKLDDDEFDTVGGLITHELGHVPTKGENCDINGFHFTVLRADERRVLQLSLRLNEAQ